MTTLCGEAVTVEVGAGWLAAGTEETCSAIEEGSILYEVNRILSFADRSWTIVSWVAKVTDHFACRQL